MNSMNTLRLLPSAGVSREPFSARGRPPRNAIWVLAIIITAGIAVKARPNSAFSPANQGGPTNPLPGINPTNRVPVWTNRVPPWTNPVPPWSNPVPPPRLPKLPKLPIVPQPVPPTQPPPETPQPPPTLPPSETLPPPPQTLPPPATLPPPQPRPPGPSPK